MVALSCFNHSTSFPSKSGIWNLSCIPVQLHQFAEVFLDVVLPDPVLWTQKTRPVNLPFLSALTHSAWEIFHLSACQLVPSLLEPKNRLPCPSALNAYSPVPVIGSCIPASKDKAQLLLVLSCLDQSSRCHRPFICLHVLLHDHLRATSWSFLLAEVSSASSMVDKLLVATPLLPSRHNLLLRSILLRFSLWKHPTHCVWQFLHQAMYHLRESRTVSATYLPLKQ